MDSAVLIAIVVAVVILVIAVSKALLRAKGRKKSEAYAAERGWQYTKSDMGILDTYPQLFPFYSSSDSRDKPGVSFSSGDQGQAHNILCFTADGYPGQSFTYSYTTYDHDSTSNTNSQINNWHVTGLELPSPFPSMSIRRRQRVRDSLGVGNSDVVELPYPDLKAAYTVRCEHPEAALDIVTPEMAQWLLENNFKNEIILQDQRIYVYSKGSQDLEKIDAMVEQLTGFLALIPESTWQKTQGTYPRPKRVTMASSLNLNQMKDIYQEWRENR